MVVYLDAFVGLNFLVDLLLLLGVNHLAGHPPGVGRAVAAAAVGGGYAGMCLVPGFRFLGSGLWRTVSLGLMSWTAFGTGRSGWSRGVLFGVMSLSLGGLAMLLDSGGWGVALCAGTLVFLCRMGFRQMPGRRILPMRLTYGGRTKTISALVDTGNALRDPLTGEGVSVLCPEVGRWLGIPEEVLRDPVSNLSPGVRLLPCGTALGGGLLPVVRCEQVLVGGRESSTLVAFAREDFAGGEYQALTGGQYG